MDSSYSMTLVTTQAHYISFTFSPCKTVTSDVKIKVPPLANDRTFQVFLIVCFSIGKPKNCF